MSAVIDLFAGPGGIDIALRELGVDALGIEWDNSACATRAAAGLRTLQADVSKLDPLDFAPVTGLAGGPPCPAFSMAGKGEGRDAIGFYRDAIERMGRGEQVDRDEMDAACGDERAHLVVEPLRWALALSPRWIALEQVPPALPLWEATGDVLRGRGYHVWTGVLSAERYGVPQTRKRAILLAHRDRPVGQPPATHQSYIAPRRRDEATDSLFDAPDPQRIVRLEEGHLQPWVSMAEALGWAPSDRYLNGTHDHRAERDATEPAPTLHFGQRLNSVMRAGAQANATERIVDEPAPTITAGHDHGERAWIVDTGNTPAPVVTLQEALVLQSFPPDYPVHGSKTRQFEQVGNAFPPLMALRVLETVVDAEEARAA